MKEDLQKELQALEATLQELMAKEDRSLEDVKKINEVCDQIEELTSRLDSEERAQKAIDGLRKPVGEHADPGQPVTDRSQKFESFGEYLQAVARASTPRGMRIGGQPSGRIDNRLMVPEDAEERSSGLESSTPSLGGFLVQQDFANEIYKKAHEAAKIFPLVRKIPVSSNSNGLKLPYVDETSRADGSRWGGIRLYWLEEGGEKTASYPKFGLMELSLNKLAGIAYATDELLQDAMALGEIMSQGFAEEMAFKVDDSLINGTGAGQPLGILNAACLVSVSKETGQAATTILWENIKKMYARLHSSARANMVWLANQDCLPELMSMVQAVGTGGVPVWMPANGAYGLKHDTLMGRPIIYPEQCQTLGTVGDILLVDPTQYLCITKGGLASAQSMHVRFIYDEQTFRFVYRIDGQPLWNSAMTPYKGTSNTQSPFIALATRS